MAPKYNLLVGHPHFFSSHPISRLDTPNFSSKQPISRHGELPGYLTQWVLTVRFAGSALGQLPARPTTLSQFQTSRLKLGVARRAIGGG